MLDRWNEHTISQLPTGPTGRMILEALLDRPTPIPIWDQYLDPKEVHEGDREMTLADVITDSLNTPNDQIVVVDNATCTRMADMKSPAILAHMLMSSNPMTWRSHHRLITFLDIPFTLQGSHLSKTRLPFHLASTSIVPRTKGKIDFSSSLCPAGSVTNIHSDYSGAGQLMIGTNQNKLWLLWPLTDHNLAKWSAYHHRVLGPQDTMRLIEELEDLQLMHMKGKETFVLPPYTLHCVLTFEVSVHAGVQIWSFYLFDDAKRIMEWEIRWAVNYDTNGFTREEGLEALENILEMGIQKYMDLANMFSEHPRAPEVLSWAKKTEEKVISSLNDMKAIGRHENTSKKRKNGSAKNGTDGRRGKGGKGNAKKPRME
jgi:hypothetical protein